MAYGYQIYDAAGETVYDATRTATRLVASFDKAGNFSGTVSVPEFDDTLGLFAVQLHAEGVHDPYTNNGDLSAWWVNATMYPTLVWNNTTNVMTITPFSPYTQYASGYTVVFVHFR
jgi:hypothetical protein